MPAASSLADALAIAWARCLSERGAVGGSGCRRVAVASMKRSTACKLQSRRPPTRNASRKMRSPSHFTPRIAQRCTVLTCGDRPIVRRTASTAGISRSRVGSVWAGLAWAGETVGLSDGFRITQSLQNVRVSRMHHALATGEVWRRLRGCPNSHLNAKNNTFPNGFDRKLRVAWKQ